MSTRLVSTEAKRLAVGDIFIPDDKLLSSLDEGLWSWTVLGHVFTGRGDYSTVVEYDGCTWTERLNPDEPVWLVNP